MSNKTYIIKKRVDHYHSVGLVFAGPDDEYHRGLVKLGGLVVVPEAKPAKAPAKPATEPEPESGDS